MNHYIRNGRFYVSVNGKIVGSGDVGFIANSPTGDTVITNIEPRINRENTVVFSGAAGTFLRAAFAPGIKNSRVIIDADPDNFGTVPNPMPTYPDPAPPAQSQVDHGGTFHAHYGPNGEVLRGGIE